MKKIIIFTIITMFPFLVMSQSSIGFKAGANFSNYGITSEAKNNWSANLTPGYQVGAFYSMEFGGMFGVQLEAMYSRRGTAYRSKTDVLELIAINTTDPNNQTVSFINGEETSKRHINYLDFPMLFRYNMRGRAIRPYLAAGPQLGFALSASLKDQLIDGTISTHKYNPATDNITPEPISIKEDFHTFDNRRLEIGNGRNDVLKGTDFGILLGAGLEIELDFGSILIEARYYMGMSNIRNSDNPANAIRNRSLMVNVGYVVPLY